MSIPDPHPDLSCPTCQEPHIVTGETDADRERALAEWPGCCPEDAQ